MRIQTLVPLFLLSVTCLLQAANPETDADAEARKAELKPLAERLKYQEGKITIGDGLATLSLPENFRYLDPAGSQILLSGLWGNPSAETLGVIVPKGFDPF